MPSTDTFATKFPDLPPFPDDVPVAPLARLSLQRLLDDDVEETKRLWHACSNFGFFYLDVRGSHSSTPNGHKSANGTSTTVTNDAAQMPITDGDAFVQDANRLFKVSDEIFDLPVEEKVKYDLSGQGSYFGYKGYGAGFTDRKGTKDRNEFYNVSKDDMLSLSDPLPQPLLFDAHRPLLQRYMTNAHSIVTLILTRLNQSLDLPDSRQPVLATLHRLKARSGDQVRFIRAPPQPMDDRQAALGVHTDFGSVTLLFNKLGGLQVYPPPELKNDEGKPYNDWLYVQPLPGHCIVNLGDAMVKFTAGLLKSATHRVVNPPGHEQGSLTRTSLVYFARPEDEVTLKVLKGRGSRMIDEAAAEREKKGEKDEEINAHDWTIRRALGRRGVGNYTMNDSDGTEVKGSV